MSWKYYWATGKHNAQPSYGQYQYGGCLVGCGPVAWAMLFGWADRQAANGNAYWAPRWGIYRVNGGKGANAVAPLDQDAGIRNVIEEIRGQVGTFCVGSNGATWPWNMDGAQKYLNPRTGAYIRTNYNDFGFTEGRLMAYARDSIRYRATPAVIGTGWLQHYPVAYGYAVLKRTVKWCFLWHCWYETTYHRWFYVNQGNWGSGNGWVSADTWFAGEIYP
jgi:hypothetical protein